MRKSTKWLVTLLVLVIVMTVVTAIVSWFTTADSNMYFSGELSGTWSPDSDHFAYIHAESWIAPRPHGPLAKEIVSVCWFKASDPNCLRSLKIDEYEPPEPIDGPPPSHQVVLAFTADSQNLAVKTRNRWLLIDMVSAASEEITEAQYAGLGLFRATTVHMASEYGGAPSPDGRLRAVCENGHFIVLPILQTNSSSRPATD